MFEFEACEVFYPKEFTIVNDWIKNEHNEEIGHYGQTLIIGYFQSNKKKDATNFMELKKKSIFEIDFISEKYE